MSAPAPEVTRYFPRPGRTPPARLQLVRPNPFEEERTAYARPTTGATWEDILRMRGELPAGPPKPTRGPKRKPKADMSPWNRPGFVYPEPEDQQGKRAREIASCREGLEKIRSTPKNLAALLKTPEWKGARVVGNVPSPLLGQAEHALVSAEARLDEARREIAALDQRIQAAPTDNVRETLEASRRSMWKARDQRSQSVTECAARLNAVRAEEWIRVVHPSGTELTIRPQWGE